IGASDTFCGFAFSPGVLAITSGRTASTGAFSEVVVLFNASLPWSTYPGPLQPVVTDFHRVAIHEFGHVLGLDHPDQHGQNVDAIMNSHISDLDGLQADDIAGVNAIYPSNTGPTSALENPPQGSAVSGISVISGWKCTAGTLTFTIDNGPPGSLVYGSSRGDTPCNNPNNGFVTLWNWNLVGA